MVRNKKRKEMSVFGSALKGVFVYMVPLINISYGRIECS